MPVFSYSCCGCYLEQIEGGVLADQQNDPPTCRVCGQVMSRVLAPGQANIRWITRADAERLYPKASSRRFKTESWS